MRSGVDALVCGPMLAFQIFALRPLTTDVLRALVDRILSVAVSKYQKDVAPSRNGFQFSLFVVEFIEGPGAQPRNEPRWSSSVASSDATQITKMNKRRRLFDLG
ncbi:hypothetical protein Q1695_002672 [Nippostrongylus brasiliensis]|nr:hypothetical protein Q1695_002672 [Nippostrongylus brasiliensis]